MLCLVGCNFDTEVKAIVKNNTSITQEVDVFDSATGNLYLSFSVEPNQEYAFSSKDWFRVKLSTDKQFDESFVISYKKNYPHLWIIDNAEKSTYTIKSELDFDITLQNFNIVNGAKSNPCYSVFIPNNSSINIATIDVYPEWLGSIWDLENRNVETINDYTDTNFQSVVINGNVVRYEIIKSDNTLLIRYR